MPQALVFEVDSRVVQKTLDSVSAACEDLSEPMDEAGDELLEFFGKKTFDSQGSALGERWRALARSTVAARGKRTGYYKQNPVETGKTLVWTGRLRAGFQKDASKQAIRIFNDVPYASYHQNGSGNRPPKRKLLAITSDVIAIVTKKVKIHAFGKLL